MSERERVRVRERVKVRLRVRERVRLRERVRVKAGSQYDARLAYIALCTSPDRKVSNKKEWVSE